MPQKSRIKLTQEEFDNSTIPFNHVAIELLRVEKDATTPSGIKYGFLEDTQWEDDEDGKANTHPADITQVVGTVVKVPDRLWFDVNAQDGMLWDTDMELLVGDIVWFNVIESANANEVHINTSSGINGGKIIRIIPYQDVYVAKRLMQYPMIRDKYIGGIDDYTKVVCLNGYCLLEQVEMPRLSKYDITPKGIFEDRGVVKYLGTPNRRYQGDKYSDDIDVKVGDAVFLRPGYRPFPLERVKYNSTFDGGKQYWCVQRRRIIFAI